LGIGINTDSGYKLDVNGTGIFRGDLSTSSGKNMLFGTTLPSRHTNSAAYPGIFIGNSNSAIFGETGTGYKGIGMYANIVRDTSLGWVHQDTTQPGWIVGVNYQTANTDYFAIIRSAATAGTISPVTLFKVFGNGNVGIGITTDAGYKLDVSGTARVSGIAALGGIVAQRSDTNEAILQLVQNPSGNSNMIYSIGDGYLGWKGRTAGGSQRWIELAYGVQVVPCVRKHLRSQYEFRFFQRFSRHTLFSFPVI
jgi:hypothetical protein